MRNFSVIQIIIYLTSISLIAGTLTGRVTVKKTGEPLAGANIYLKGTTVGSATDEEGMYYDLKNSDNKRVEKFRKKSNFIDNELQRRQKERANIVGSFIEIIPG